MNGIRIVADRAEWRKGFEERVLCGYRAAGCSEPLARALLDKALKGIDDWTVATDGTGWIAVGVDGDGGAAVGRIHDLTAVAGGAAAGRAWAERWCAGQGARRVEVRLTGGAGAAAFADYPVRGQNRMRAAAERPGLPAGLTVRPLTEAEYPGWYAGEEAAYVADIVRAGALTAEQAKAKSDEDFARFLPRGMRTPGHAFYALEAGGQVIGTGWVNHGFLPGVTFGFSLEVYEEHRGKGYGRAAMAVGEWATRQGGDEAMMFNVFGGNKVAMGLYDSTGFAVLDEIRSRAL
ncbi:MULTISPECIES: GNAT family N-acetyltransferase [unclassified Streptomyces]|uniref:GNAT family N-acetyltransferase n=1 Tax=unclassified Streptomyces TaxID=2593676 RepID=UPI000DC7BB08|nr:MULTISPECIES: GNAT family N-acetyltransferase [unclassified Streptomyces]AWZ05733.1 N-acetyltransferase [Streptomyces sp. ICC4]AWZ14532.1 N-acetyltransferase [Streptomyces sp. ICC1]